MRIIQSGYNLPTKTSKSLVNKRADAHFSEYQTLLHITSIIHSHCFWTSVKSHWWQVKWGEKQNIKRAITPSLHTNKSIFFKKEAKWVVVVFYYSYEIKQLLMGTIKTVMLEGRIMSFIQLVRVQSFKRS